MCKLLFYIIVVIYLKKCYILFSEKQKSSLRPMLTTCWVCILIQQNKDAFFCYNNFKIIINNIKMIVIKITFKTSFLNDFLNISYHFLSYSVNQNPRIIQPLVGSDKHLLLLLELVLYILNFSCQQIRQISTKLEPKK